MGVLESQLIIKATDQTAKAFETVEARIKLLEQSALEVERVFANLGRVTSEASLFAGVAQREDMNIAIANMERMIGLTEKAAAAQRTLAQSATAAGGALAREGRAGSAGMVRIGGGSGGGGAGGARAASSEGAFVGIGKGVLPVMAAIGIYEVGKKAVENAAELEQQRYRIRELSRNDPSEAPLADSLASEVAGKYPGITRAKALETYTELRANSVDASGRVDPAVARRNLMAGSRAQNAALALGFEMTPADMQSLLKGVEGSGRAADPKAVEKITDAYIRAKQVFGSAIAANMIRDYTANAKSANFSIGDDQFYLSNLVRMSEGNASRLGNEVNQTLSTMVGGHMTKATGDWMVAHGLARRDQIVKTGPGTIAIKGGLKNADTLQTDQGLWAATTLRKSIEDSGALSDAKVQARAAMLRAQELKRNPNADIDERFLHERAEEGLLSAELAKSGMRTTVTDNLAHFIANQRLIERDIAAMQNASGTAAGDNIAKNPVAAFTELSNAISGFGAALAGPAVAGAAPLLDSLAKAIVSLTAALPDAFKKIAEAAHSVGVFLGGDGSHVGPDPAMALRQAYARQSDMHPIIRGERDMEGARAGALSRLMEGGHTTQDVEVHGDAVVQVQSSVTVTASSELLRVVEDAKAATKTAVAQMALNPVQGGHLGAMNSDAAPIARGMPGRL